VRPSKGPGGWRTGGRASYSTLATNQRRASVPGCDVPKGSRSMRSTPRARLCRPRVPPRLFRSPRPRPCPAPAQPRRFGTQPMHAFGIPYLVWRGHGDGLRRGQAPRRRQPQRLSADQTGIFL
jgi:hypothetical protein